MNPSLLKSFKNDMDTHGALSSSFFFFLLSICYYDSEIVTVSLPLKEIYQTKLLDITDLQVYQLAYLFSYYCEEIQFSLISLTRYLIFSIKFLTYFGAWLRPRIEFITIWKSFFTMTWDILIWIAILIVSPLANFSDTNTGQSPTL